MNIKLILIGIILASTAVSADWSETKFDLDSPLTTEICLGRLYDLVASVVWPGEFIYLNYNGSYYKYRIPMMSSVSSSMFLFTAPDSNVYIIHGEDQIPDDFCCYNFNSSTYTKMGCIYRYIIQEAEDHRRDVGKQFANLYAPFKEPTLFQEIKIFILGVICKSN